MSTNITINVSGNRLLQQSREAQTANRQQLTQKEVDDKFLADVRQIEAAELARQRDGAVPEYRIQEQTSAQRGGFVLGNFDLLLGGFAGGDTGVESSDSRALFIPQETLWTSPVAYNIEGSIPFDGFPNRDALYDEVLNQISSAYAPNQYYYYNNTFADPFTISAPTIEGSGTGIAGPGNMQRRYSQVYRYENLVCLPVAKDKFIACWIIQKGVIHNFIQLIDPPFGSTIGTTSVTTTSEVKDTVVECVLMTSRTARKIPCPPLLKTAIEKIYPSDMQTVTIGPIAVIGDNPNSSSFNFDYSYVYYVQGFDPNELSSRRTYPTGFAYYGRQFGIGTLSRNSHGLNDNARNSFHFSPGVFKWLNGDLADMNNLTDVSQLIPLEYARYRADYFTNAPKFYINTELSPPPYISALPASGYTPEQIAAKLKIGTTTTEPLDFRQPVPAETFKKVPIKVRKQIWIWDWNDPNYCRSELSKLGFTPADLTP